MGNDEISRYLAALEREDCYQVDATLKESAYELTQRVSFVGANGTHQGPLVRKFIHRDSGLGGAYERIYEAQRNGCRFKHIPAITECYHHEDLLVVVMEFVSGETLQDCVYRHDPSAQLASRVFPLLCDAVTELHESFDPPLIHRDLKPSNVMLSEGGLTIIDFGIAREFKQGADADTMKFGTRAFAPPEQFGFGQTTVRSDVYALGMLLYYCLAEKNPTPQIRDAKFQEDDVPDCLRPILIRATALDPDERYASAREMKEAFLHAAEQLDKNPKAEKRPTVAIAVTCIILALVIAACALFAAGPLNQPDNRGSTAASETQPTSEPSTEPSTSASEEAKAEETARATLDETQVSAPPRDGFDPATNISTTVAGVTFQIPGYFGARVEQAEGGATYYYAEWGSSSALIMTGENTLNRDADGDGEPDEDLNSIKDKYLGGLLGSDKELFSELISSTDFKLAGYDARIVTIRGTVKGVPITTKAVYFINSNLVEGADVIGTIMFGQSDNVQFDYSADFAKTVASATPA